MLTAALGYVYLGAVLTLLAALLAAAAVSVIWLRVAGAKIAILVGAFLWVVLRALWVNVAPPEGTEVTERESPELFAMIEQLRLSLRAPRFHHVLVTDDFNAGVVQAPRLGLFGWHRNYLLIGLPLAKGLTAEQFKAVLDAVDPMVDQTGRAISSRARLDNASGRLRPGMFVRVRLLFGDRKNVLMVPEQAIVPGKQPMVFKVVDGKALATTVRLGVRRAAQVEVVDGLVAGDIVVTAGQLKLRDGAPVRAIGEATPGAPPPAGMKGMSGMEGMAAAQ